MLYWRQKPLLPNRSRFSGHGRRDLRTVRRFRNVSYLFAFSRYRPFAPDSAGFRAVVVGHVVHEELVMLRVAFIQ